MKKKNEQHINQVLNSFAVHPKISSKLNAAKIKSNWAEIMGKPIAAYTLDIELKANCLLVRLSSAPLRHELMLNQELIIHKINSYFGQQIIDSLKLR